MSRVGKLPIKVPSGVKVTLNGRRCQVEGPKGKLSMDLPPHTKANQDGDRLIVEKTSTQPRARAMHGLARALLNNMVEGVSKGYSRRLEIHGVGFKAALQGKILNLSLGYSHPVHYQIPDQISVKVEENTKVVIEGPDKQVVGRVASEIRSYYPPEPYKGKGVRYSDEKVVRKEGKKAQ